MATGIGITIGSSTLRAVEVRRKGPLWQVARVTVVPLEGSDDGARVAAARGALQAAGAKGPALVGLTGKDLIIRYTKAPRVPLWRLEMLMRFEIQEVAEQSGGDVAADWAQLTLPPSAGDDDTVLVALARNAHLRPRLEAVRAAGTRVLGGCPRSIGLYHAFVTNAKVPPGEVTLLLHLGAENTDVAIQRDGALLFARNLAGGGKPFTDALVNAFRVDAGMADRLKQQKGNLLPRGRARYGDPQEEKIANTLLSTAGGLVAAVQSSVLFCKAQTKLADLRVDRVLLAGAGSKIRGMAEYLAQGLGVPVEPFDPFEAVDTSALSPEMQEAVSADGPSLAAALGLAQMAADPKAFRLEILPEEDRRKREFAEKTSWLIGSGVAAALGLVVLYASSGAEEARAQENETKMNAALARAAKYREDGTQREKAVARAIRRHDLLASQVELGPSVERALDLFEGVIASKRDFDGIHFPQVRASFEVEAIPADLATPVAAAGEGGEAAPAAGEPAPPAPAAGEGGDGGPLKARVPVVAFEGLIQSRGELPAAQVYARFSQALQDAVKQHLPRARMMVEKSMQATGRFELKLAFFDHALPEEDRR